MRLLTHTSRIPLSWTRACRTVPALHNWETSKTTLKNYRQQSDEEEEHNLDGLELSTENNLTLLEHSPRRVGTSDPKRVPLGWPAALGHLSLCSSAAVLQLLLLHLKTVACSLEGTLGNDFFIDVLGKSVRNTCHPYDKFRSFTGTDF